MNQLLKRFPTNGSEMIRLLRRPWQEGLRAWFRWRHRKRAVHDVACHRDGIRLLLPSDSVLAEALYVGREFECGEVALVRRLVRPGWRVLDIGANIGFYSLLLSEAVGDSGRVWSFEPFSPVAAYLRNNVERNGLKNVKVLETAVDVATGMSRLFVFAGGGDVYNSLGASRRGAEGLSAGDAVPIHTTTLDDFAASEGIESVDFIKIDVEGAEERAILSGRGLLERSEHVGVLAELYEPSAAQCGCSIERFCGEMLQMGFSMSRVLPDGGLAETGPEILVGRSTSVNILFTRAPR